MKKSGSIYVLALIFIGSVFTELNIEEYLYMKGYFAIKPGRNWTENATPKEILNAILTFQRDNGLPQTGMLDHTTENKLFAKDNYAKDLNALEKAEQPVGFCNYSYNSIDAAMRVNGIDFVFVDKGEVIDVRIEFKMAVHLVFPGGPKWVQAAVYSKRNQEAYLFQNDKIWAFAYVNGTFNLVRRFINSNKQSYNPECAFWDFSSDMFFLLKDRNFFRFEPDFLIHNVWRGSSTLGKFSINRSVDAAISSGGDVNFIVKDKVYRIGNSTRIKTNQLFSKCGK